ncbi:putative fatty acyl-CoA reductase CG5065 [Anticarsia gemmatalis]|uniref:putative fatty acyl-CoA reductase CG5065 n=1 Tax=Anticarsia gemmatalis TaxID=129554 RepID=UPI003F7737FB
MRNMCSILIGVRLQSLRKGLRQVCAVKINHVRGYASSNGDNNKMVEKRYQSIADFYAGKSVLITGGTGFLGKVFIEKLLYSCTKLDKIYLLIREKKGSDSTTRLKSIFDNPLFERIKQNCPENLEKVIPIVGDISQPSLGIKPEDEQTLIDKVSVVIHSAATVKFNEPLPVAMNINLEGTQRVLSLCKRINRMESFVYISTAFAHPSRPELGETIYPAPAEIDDVYRFMKKYGHDENKTKNILGGKPNTYIFTKALTESYLAQNHGNIPTAIIRPSGVSPTYEEPIKGWLDNWFGPTPLMYNVAVGWNRVSLGSAMGIADLIPADYVSNLTIIAAATVHKSKEIQVYNSASGCENPLTWRDVCKYSINECVKKGYNETPYPFIIFTKSRAIVNLLTLLLQIIPAHIADLWLKIQGKRPKYVKIMYEVVGYRDSVDFFTVNSWWMKADRSRELFSKLSMKDKKTFPCDPSHIIWPEYIADYCDGINKYLKPRFTVKSKK